MPSVAPMRQDTLVLIAEHARIRRFAAGDVMIVEGAPIETVYLIVDGRVTATRKGKLLTQVKRGYGVGFLSLLARDEHGIQAVADVPTQTLEVPADALLNAYEESFELVRNGLAIQAGSIVQRRGDLPVNPDNPPDAPMGTYRDRELTLVQRMIQIRQTPLFARANIDAVAELARASREVRFAPDTLLWSIGDPPSFSLRLDYGRVRCANKAGRVVTVGAGYGLGVLDSFSTRPRSYEAHTETEVIAFQSKLDTFLAVLEGHHEVAMDLIAILSRTQLPT